MDDASRIKEIMPRVVGAYSSILERAYCHVRFLILRERFTKEIVQYLPEEGRIIELGCGFGLFTLLFAHLRSQSTFLAVDRDARRIDLAREAARRLELTNVEFLCEDVTKLKISEDFDGGFTMDLIHHVGRDQARPLLDLVHARLRPGSTFIVKEVIDRPIYKWAFTRVLDLLMSPRDDVHYWPEEEMKAMLSEVGWDVLSHAMIDFLPYPHQIYICRK
ncbi:class I SAM-dependent methyltransferase [Candidatus Sumerlaeota bacterium]|nr:class I SAM-dependent methyltransferase [Candidatus Sumerlaeota bacterium]